MRECVAKLVLRDIFKNHNWLTLVTVREIQQKMIVTIIK